MTDMQAPGSESRGTHGRGAFTLFELLIVMGIIVLLASIVLLGLNVAVRGTRVTAQREEIRNLVNGVTGFRQNFDNMLPPLVVDDRAGGPLDAEERVVVRSNAFLADPVAEGGSVEDLYSEFTIPMFLLGAGDAHVDGVEGFGYTEPQAPKQTGPMEWTVEFKKRGTKFEPSANISSRLERDIDDPDHGARLKDRWGNPIRYYRWINKHYTSGNQKGEIEEFGIPPGAFTPEAWKEIKAQGIADLTGPGLDQARQIAVRVSPQLRSAEYAIVSAGIDGRMSDAPSNQAEVNWNQDNIVEVGQ